MESIFLIGLLAMVVYGAVGAQSGERATGLLTRSRRALARDRALEVEAMSHRVLLREGRARPVLECQGTYRHHGFKVSIWEDVELGARIELEMRLERASMAVRTPYSIEVSAKRAGFAWHLGGDDARAFVDAALPHGERMIALISRLEEVCGASSSRVFISSRGESSWQASFDIAQWERRGFGLSHVMSWLVALTTEMTTKSSSRPISASVLLGGLGECVESLVPEVTRIIEARSEASLATLLCGFEDEDHDRHMRRLLRGWWASKERESLVDEILALDAIAQWPQDSCCARYFAASRLEVCEDVERGWFWFVRAAHPKRSVARRVEWCVRALSSALEEHEWSLLLDACAPTIAHDEELRELLMTCETTDAQRLVRVLERTSIDAASIEQVLLDVLACCVQSDLARARLVCAILCELGEAATHDWLRVARSRRRLSPGLLEEVASLEEALGRRRQRGAISPSGQTARGHISMSTDPHGQIVVWDEEMNKE